MRALLKLVGREEADTARSGVRADEGVTLEPVVRPDETRHRVRHERTCVHNVSSSNPLIPPSSDKALRTILANLVAVALRLVCGE